MFNRIPTATTVGLAAGYLLAMIGQRVLRFFDQAGAPHFALFGSINVLFALLALIVAIGLLRHRSWARVLARVYFWFILIVSVLLSSLMLFGVIHPEDYDTSIPAFVLQIVFAIFFLSMLRRSCFEPSQDGDIKT